jgi:hypothetical protein
MTDREALELLREILKMHTVYAAPISEDDTVCVFCGAPEWQGYHRHGCLYKRIEEYVNQIEAETHAD